MHHVIPSRAGSGHEWQPNLAQGSMVQVAKFLDAGIEGCRRFALIRGRTSDQPGWLEWSERLVLSVLNSLYLHSILALVPVSFHGPRHMGRPATIERLPRRTHCKAF